MVIWAWLGALLIGLSLGLLGSGGSILTVPVLVYLVGEPDKLAIAESLGIVGLISLAASIPYILKKQVDWRTFALFGVPGIAGTYLGAYLSQWLSGAVQLVLFAVVMLLAAIMMTRSPAKKTLEEVEEEVEEGDTLVLVRRPRVTAAPRRQAAWKIMVEGVGVGVVTGLVGVGGGFLIVPALVLLGGLPMSLAVGTSLLVIAVKSAAGFLKYIDVLAASGLAVNWNLVLLFALIGTVGSFAGSLIGGRVSHDTLKKLFAIFLVAMGIFILWQSTADLL